MFMKQFKLYISTAITSLAGYLILFILDFSFIREFLVNLPYEDSIGAAKLSYWSFRGEHT